MKILLTGHEGYLGSRLHEYFRERGHPVLGVGRKEDLTTIQPGWLAREGVELVIHCAAVGDRVGRRYALGSEDERVNVLGTRRLVQALRGTDIGLLHLSTKDVYGDVYTKADVREEATRFVPSFRVGEETRLDPQTLYAKTKLIGEFLAESHPKTNILRLSTGYTSNLHPRGNWILHFCRAARAGRAVEIRGSGKQLRDPLHADDLGALLLLLQEKNAWGHTLNVGGGMEASFSVLETLDLIDRELPRNFSEGGDLGYVSDIGWAEKLVGWKPVLSFRHELGVLIEKVRRE